MNYFDILLAKKMGGGSSITTETLNVTSNGEYTAPSGKAYTPVNVNVPLPENAYLLTTITDGDLTSAKSKPLPSVSVAVTDADELDVFVGDSETIVSDNEPYMYRQSKGGRMVSERLVGASVAWNQLVPDTELTSTAVTGITVSRSADKLLSITGQRTGGAVQTPIVLYNCTAGHVYMVNFENDLPTSTDGNSRFQINGEKSDGTGTVLKYTNGSTTWKPAYGSGTQRPVYFNTSDQVAYSYSSHYALFDLTLMFGSTIADYVYSLEQSTAGSGIAWLKSYGFFSEDYYANDSGSLKSVQASEKSVVGFNQWDEEWEVGDINSTTGEKTPSSTTMRSKNYIPVFHDDIYYFKTPITLKMRYYDADKVYIGYSDKNGQDNANNNTRTMPSNCHYILFAINNTTTCNHDICINISDPNKNGTYEPYKHTTYPLPSSDLRGLYKLSSNKLYCDGDIQYGDGWRLRRYGIVDLGTLDWAYITSGTYPYMRTGTVVSNAKKPASNSFMANIICKKYVNVVPRDIPTSNVYGIAVDDGGFVRVNDSSIGTDPIAFKAAMSGVYLIYELATPTWEKTNPFTNPQTVGSTEEFVANLPVGHESKYYDGDIHHSYIYNGDARAKVTGDVDIVNGTAPNATCSVCVVMPDGDEIWSDVGDVTAEIWT